VLAAKKELGEDIGLLSFADIIEVAALQPNPGGECPGVEIAIEACARQF
jgi:hypothetical protein